MQLEKYFFGCVNFSFLFISTFTNETKYLASSASSPASTTHTRQLNLTPSAQQRQLQIQNRMQQHKIATGNILRIQHQNKSDPSSSDDGMPQQTVPHRVATGLHMAHNKTIAHAGILSENIELKTLSSNCIRHRSVNQEDSVKTTTSTISPSAISSDRSTIETNLSSTTRDDTLEKDDLVYKRSRSYHGKGSVQSYVARCCKTCCVVNLLFISLSLSLRSTILYRSFLLGIFCVTSRCQNDILSTVCI